MKPVEVKPKLRLPGTTLEQIRRQPDDEHQLRYEEEERRKLTRAVLGK